MAESPKSIKTGDCCCCLAKDGQGSEQPFVVSLGTGGEYKQELKKRSGPFKAQTLLKENEKRRRN